MKKMKKLKGLEARSIQNPVAKFAFKFNKTKVFNDKTKYQRNKKHKAKEPFPMLSLNSTVLEKVSFLTDLRSVTY